MRYLGLLLQYPKDTGAGRIDVTHTPRLLCPASGTRQPQNAGTAMGIPAIFFSSVSTFSPSPVEEQLSPSALARRLPVTCPLLALHPRLVWAPPAMRLYSAAAGDQSSYSLELLRGVHGTPTPYFMHVLVIWVCVWKWILLDMKCNDLHSLSLSCLNMCSLCFWKEALQLNSWKIT